MIDQPKLFAIPAQVGIHPLNHVDDLYRGWAPACAGVAI